MNMKTSIVQNVLILIISIFIAIIASFVPTDLIFIIILIFISIFFLFFCWKYTFHAFLFFLLVVPYHAFALRFYNLIRGTPIESIWNNNSIITIWKELFLLLLLVIVILKETNLLKGKIPKPNQFELLLVIFILLGIVYIPVSGNFTAGIYGFNYSFRYIFAYFLVLYMPLTISQIKKIISLIIINTFFIFLFGIIQKFYLGKSFFLLFLPPDKLGNVIETFGGNIRMMSFLGSPNDFGLFMFLSLTLVLSMIVFNAFKNKKAISLLYIVCFMFFLGILFSYSRSVFIATIVSFMLFGIKIKNRLVLSMAIATITTIFMLSVLFISGYEAQQTLTPVLSSFNRIYAALELRDSSSQFHLNAKLSTIDILVEHPFGLGLGRAGHIGRRFFPESNIWGESWWLQRGIEMGIWLYPLVFMILASAIMRGLGQLKKVQDRYLKSLSFASITILLGFCIAALTFPAWSDFATTVHAWIILGLGLNVKKIELRSNING